MATEDARLDDVLLLLEDCRRVCVQGLVDAQTIIR